MTPTRKDTDPANDGQGGPGYTVDAEIKLPHVRGAVATARIGDAANPTRASSGSQFFIDVAARAQSGCRWLLGVRAGDLRHGGGGQDRGARRRSLRRRAARPANPGKKALVTKATLEPLSKWEKPAAAADKTENKTAEAKPDDKK